MSKALIALDKSGSFRVYLGLTTELAKAAGAVHQPSPLGMAGLSRVLTGSGLMGLMLLKNPADKLTVQFKGEGPAREILATANGGGKVKGYIANPQVELPLKKNGGLDVGESLGIGLLTVIRDTGMKEPYVGKIALVSGEIAEDLTMYFFVSEQQSTSVALGEKIGTDGTVEAAGGMIIQMMPDAGADCVDALEALIDRMPSFSSLLVEAQEEAGRSPVKSETAALDWLLLRIFGDLPQEYGMETLEYRDLEWECDCSEERLEQVVMSIGKKDLTEILEEDGQAELVCQFCRKAYLFDREHLERLLAEL